MKHYTGVDIIEIERIRQAIARWGNRFLHRVYTESELKRYGNKPSSLATRFAGKEAVMKLLGTGLRGAGWREIETLSHPGGKPQLKLYGRAKTRARRLRLKGIAISLSHSREYAIAFAAANAEPATPEAP